MYGSPVFKSSEPILGWYRNGFGGPISSHGNKLIQIVQFPLCSWFFCCEQFHERHLKKTRTNRQNREVSWGFQLRFENPNNPGWWFEPLWKILVNWDDIWETKIDVPNHQPESPPTSSRDSPRHGVRHAFHPRLSRRALRIAAGGVAQVTPLVHLALEQRLGKTYGGATSGHYQSPKTIGFSDW